MRYVFVDCILDTRLYTLYRGGTVIRLRPKAFHVLQYLLEHRDHVVSKDELCTHVWPGQFISDATLEGCITLARRAIGDSGQGQRLIASRRGYGYRFVGIVQEEAPPEEPRTLGVGEVAHVPVLSPPPGASSPGLPVQGVPEGERKLVTLLSCALVTAPDSQTSMDLEVLHSQIRTLYALAQREVHQYGGMLQQVAGDRLLAVFGAPLAQEDHAQRAALAALGLHQRLTATPVPNRDPAPLKVCIGLHTTLSIVGPLGEAPDLATAVIGETSRVLEALQRQADPGTVVCSNATAPWLKGMVRLQAARPRSGGAPPMFPEVYTVLGIRAGHLPGAWRTRQRRGPFVERGHELATLHMLLAQVEAGRGQLVGIVGAPGIGKSRLLVEFQHRLRGRQLTYLRGRCLSYSQTTPYLPVLDLLRHACGIMPTDQPQDVAMKVRRGLHQVDIVSEEAAALLLALLGVEGEPGPLASLSPEVRKARTFTTLVQMCLHGSQQRPLILEFEDLHWSDATSEEWLTAFGTSLGTAPILVLGTYRPGYRPPWLDTSYATQLALQPLSLQASWRLVQGHVPAAMAAPPLVQALLAKAAGNPFFLEELARNVREQGAPGLSLKVPETVQAVLAARIDRLPPKAKKLLQVAAVCGVEVPFPLLYAVVAQPEEDLQHQLATLQAAELLAPQRLFPSPLYAFQHVLTQEVAYYSLLKSTRQHYHARIAQVLAGQFPETARTQPELLAHHYTEAGHHEQALGYWQRAGEHATQRSAHVEAVAHLSRGLEILRALPDTPARAQSELRLLTG